MQSSFRQAYTAIMARASEHVDASQWAVLTQTLALSQDPGATVPLVEAVARALRCFTLAETFRQAGLGSLQDAIDLITHQPEWQDGSWPRAANPRQRGGRHGGNIEDRPILASLVADPRATTERTSLEGFRLLILLSLVSGNTRPAATLVVAEAVRKAEAMEAWRLVIRTMPMPSGSVPDLQAWLATVSEYLQTATPPSALANVPAASIRNFYASLLLLLRMVADANPNARRQADLFDAPPEPQGSLRSATARRRLDADAVGRLRAAASNTPFADREIPAQEALSFDEDSVDSGCEPATLTLLVNDAVAPSEQASSNRASDLQHRLASYRLVELRHRLPWSWDLLNPLDHQILLEALEQDLPSQGPRWRGALVAAVMFGMGLLTEAVPGLRLGWDSGGDWISTDGVWHRHIRRPASAWQPAHSLFDAMQPSSKLISLALHPLLKDALVRMMSLAPYAENLGEALELTKENVLAVLSEWLAPLRASNPSVRLTHGRIRRAVQAELAAIATHEVVVQLLAGSAEDVPPVCSYYVAVSEQALAEVWQQAQARLFGQYEQVWTGQDRLVGAPVLTGQALTAWVRSLRDAVASAQSLVDQHNSFCLFVVWHLMASTAHRPVDDPFESLDLFDLSAGLCLLADKSAHAPREARLVPLCTMTQAILVEWLVHLSRLSRWLPHEQALLALRIESALELRGRRALPLFFLLDSDWQVQPIDTSTLAASIPIELSGLATNQFRREIATHAKHRGWSPELIQEIMGHVDLGEGTYGPTSCRSPADLAELQPVLEHYLTEQGWRPLKTPLAEGPSRRGRPLPRTKPAPMQLGAQRRIENAQKAARRISERIERCLRRWCKGRDWRVLQQVDVDALYREALQGRSNPSTESELVAVLRIDRLLRWVKRRHDLKTLRLPACRAVASTTDMPFKVGDMAILHLWRAMRQALCKTLRNRARSIEQSGSPRHLAEGIVSLVLNSLVSDPLILRALTKPATWRLVVAPQIASFVVVTRQQSDGRVAINRYPLDPLTWALLARIKKGHGTSPADYAAECRRAMLRLITSLRDECGDSSQGPFSNADVAMEWLGGLAGVAARMRLPGVLAAYLDGTAAAVSTCEHDWQRWMTGGHPSSLDNSDLAEPATDLSQPDRPAEMLLPARARASDGEQRAAALSLHKSVRHAITQVERKAEDIREETHRSLNRSKELLPLLQDVLQRHEHAPEYPRMAVQWFMDLLRSGLNDRSLKSASAERYYEALMPRLVDVAHAITLREAHEDVLTQVYAELLDLTPRKSRTYALGRLQEFHAFAVRHHGVPELDWSEIEPEDLDTGRVPDAGLVLWDDYLAALALLAEDPTTELRERQLQSCILILMFRFGLRAGEVIGLRYADLFQVLGLWVVMVRANAYRELKSDAGVRQVPLVGPLSPLEQEMLKGWHTHADEMAGNDRCAALLSEPERPRRLVDRHRLMKRVTEALRAVTGSPSIRPHHLRHSFGSRTTMLMCVPTLPTDPTLLNCVRRVIGPCDPQAARLLLTKSEDLSKRGMWAVSMAVGHASPKTTLRWYTHVHDLLLTMTMPAVFGEVEVKLDTATASYVCGRKLKPSRHWITIDAEWAGRHCAGNSIRLPPTAADGGHAPVLPARKPSPTQPLSPLTVDRLLDLVHRRSRVDWLLARRLMQAPDVIEVALKEDFRVRESAGYDIQHAGWAPTPSTSAVSHARAGSRLPAETERVRALLRGLHGQLRDPAWVAIARDAASVWQRRYRAQSTPLILVSTDEVFMVAQWCLASGVAAEDLLLLSPNGQAPPAEPRLDALGLTRAEGDLAPARTQYRAQGRWRLGLQVKENDRGPLTQMTQLHRSLHVLSTWLMTNDKFESNGKQDR